MPTHNIINILWYPLMFSLPSEQKEANRGGYCFKRESEVMAMRMYEKRPPAARQATTPQQAQQTVPSGAGNQAMLAMLGIQDRSGDTRFSEALRARFEPKPMPQAERSQPMALSPEVMQKAEERYQTPLAGLKAYEDTGLLDSGYNGYAQGNEIHIDGSLAPAKREEVLMHEIGHVVQRGSGKAQGSGLLDNPALEQQADQGFAAPQSFAMPTSAVGPVMGNRTKGVDRTTQAAELRRAKTIFRAAFGLDDTGPTPTLDIKGLNGRIMRKNAQNMSAVFCDFPDAQPTKFVKKRMSSVMSTYRNGEISVNKSRFKKRKPVNEVNQFFGNYGFDIANDNYTGVHEMGHIVNARLIDRLRANEDDRSNDWRENQTAQFIIARALANVAENDPNLRQTIFDVFENAGIHPDHNDFDFNDTHNINAMVRFMTNGDTRLIAALHRAGYTSGYGASDAGEFFAEAFADRYRYKSKKQRYRANRNVFQANRKLLLLRRQKNPLSKEIVKIAKMLNDDAVYRNTFQHIHDLQ